MPSTFIKDPSAVLDYVFDWSAWLTDGETISTRTITATTGITVASSAITGSSTTVTVWLSGGTAGATYYVTCAIVTSASRTDERTVTIRVTNR
jgi:hypothetical protein